MPGVLLSGSRRHEAVPTLKAQYVPWSELLRWPMGHGSRTSNIYIMGIEFFFYQVGDHPYSRVFD